MKKSIGIGVIRRKHQKIPSTQSRGYVMVLTLLLSSYVVVCISACTGEGRNPASNLAAAQSADSNAATTPARPAVFLETKYPQPGGRTISVTGTGDAATRAFQAALDSARSGDVIAIEPGSIITGNFVLPNKLGTGWTVVRSSSADGKLPAPGNRVKPTDAVAMPKLVTPNADPVIRTASGAHHYRFVGIEFTIAPGWEVNHGLILFGDGGRAQDSQATVPHDLIIDRCYLHGNAEVNLRRAVALNSAATAIVDSHISDIHEAGADSQALCGWNGPGPFKIVNNYLEAAGENVMFGGADPSIPNLVPSDIEFRQNFCAKPLSWMRQHSSYAGKPWSVKNLFELKNARRAIIDGNLFENNWVDGQSGFAILFTVRNQDGSAPWSAVEDIAFTNNIVRHTAAGVNFLGRDDNHPSQQVRRVLIANNLFDDVGSKQWGSNGRFLQITDCLDVTIDHNTAFHTGNIITAYGAPTRGFVFTNNIVPHNEYGIIGDGAGIGNPTLEKYFPGGVFKKNVIAGGRNSIYPGDNFFPATMDAAKFADRTGGSYGLSDSSPYKKAGTDGKNIGCNIDALKTASGSSPTPVRMTGRKTTNGRQASNILARAR
ncbi:MAG: hypothetical protein WAV47_12540 [Blastocatellia bacterium]